MTILTNTIHTVLMRSFIIIIISFYVFTLSSKVYAVEYDYPKTRDEIRAQEIGSIVGGDGIVFRPGKTKNLSTKTPDTTSNSYLWEATKDIVEDIAPISFADPSIGEISTEWYSNINDPNRSFKIKVIITNNVINSNSLKLELKQKIFKKGRWLEEKVSSKISSDLEAKILRRARQLYLRNTAK